MKRKKIGILTVKESYALLVHAVIDESSPPRASVIVTTDEYDDREYHIVAECGVEDAWLIIGALQFQSDIKHQKMLAECEEIALQITQENLKAIKTELKNTK